MKQTDEVEPAATRRSVVIMVISMARDRPLEPTAASGLPEESLGSKILPTGAVHGNASEAV